MMSKEDQKASSPDPTIDDEDAELVALLDQYLNDMGANRSERRRQLIQEHPELAELVSCLDDLDSLAMNHVGAARTGSTITDNYAEEFPTESTISYSGSKDGSSQFGKYELLHELGRGGMGVVFRARQTDLDRTVALKMILANRLASQEDIARFYAEAKAAGSLQHSNIVGIHEVGQINGQHYFAMDCVEGPSLADRLRHGPMEPRAAAQCLATVASAVEYLHQHDIIHRDLKPSNILLNDEDAPFVTDFGLAKLFQEGDERTRSGVIIGTPGFMAPEQAAGKSSEVTPASDVYSLGALLYATLTGKPPFEAATPLDTLVQVLERDPIQPSAICKQIPRELELVCLQCLERDPRNRYATAADVAKDLERFLLGEPVQAKRKDFQLVARRWGRRQPALAARLIALFIAALIIQVYYSTAGSDLNFHVKNMLLLGVWACSAIGFQQILARNIFENGIRYLWAAADVIFLTSMIQLQDPPIDLLLASYPLLIAASGAFFQVRMVTYMTTMAVLGFSTLSWNGYLDHAPLHYQIICTSILVLVGAIVGYQVYRIRVLTRYFDRDV